MVPFLTQALKTDPVLVGLVLIVSVTLFGAGVYVYSIVTGRNGHYQDTYIALLLLSFAGNYSYLFIARIMKYVDQETFLFMLARNRYIPPLYISLIVLIAMITHKIVDIRRKG